MGEGEELSMGNPELLPYNGAVLAQHPSVPVIEGSKRCEVQG